MLLLRHVAAIHAALTYFEEEIVPHGPEAARPYWNLPGGEPLTAEEFAALRTGWEGVALRYVACDSQWRRVLRPTLFTRCDEALAAAGRPDQVAAALLTAHGF